MVAPINYMLDIQDPVARSLQMAQVGQVLGEQRQGRQAAEAAAETNRQLQLDLSELFSQKRTPTAADFAQLTLKYPGFNEQFEQAWGMLDEQQKTNRIGQASEVYAALEAQEPEIALGLLETQAQAAENAGDPRSAKAARTLAEMVRLNPATAQTSVALRLSSMMGPERFTETFTKLETDRRSRQLETAELTEAEAKANVAAVESGFAESNAAANLQRKGWDILKIQNDIDVARENSRIAALNSDMRRVEQDLEREKIGIRREELAARLRELDEKRKEMERKRDIEINERTADVESTRGDIDNMLNSLDRALQTPIGTIEAATGPVSQWTPTLRQSTADFQELMETLGSQAFLTQIPKMKGMGSLSGPEGDKLTAALQNLGLRQSPERLLENIREAQRLILKARENLSLRYGVPDTVPETPAVETPPAELESIMQRYLQPGG